jgi:hypothetical protein
MVGLRQSDREAGAAARWVLDPDLATDALDDPFDDRQAEAETWTGPAVSAPEPMKNPVALIGGYALSLIRNPD